MKTLYRYYFAYSGAKFRILILQLIQYAIAVALPFFFGSLIAELSAQSCQIHILLIKITSISILNFLSIVIERHYACSIIQETASMELLLKEKALDAYQEMNEETCSRCSFGEWSQRISSDSSLIANCSVPVFSLIHGALIIFILTSSIILIDKPIYIVSIFICCVFFILLFKFRQERLMLLNQKYREQLYKEHTTLLDILALKSLMKVFRVIPFLSQRYRDDATEACEMGIQAACTSTIYTSEIQFLIWVTDSSVLALSVYLYMHDIIGVDSLIAYGLLLNRITGQLGQLLFRIPQLSRGVECVTAMEAYLKSGLPENQKVILENSLPHKEEILFKLKNVYFSYNFPQKLILNNICLSVKKNKYISILGRNGEGKSTLIKIILGLLKPSSGVIQNRVIRPSYVPQNVIVFRGSLWDNLTLCDVNIPAQAVEKAINQTRLQDLVNRIGLNSTISQEQLSGGELQRIGIARALLINPDLLIVDEITNHLDILNKELIFNILKEQKERCTIISISHDSEAFEDSDECLLLSDGQLHPIEGTTGVEKRANLYHMLNHA